MSATKKPSTRGLRICAVHLGTFDYTVNAVVGNQRKALAWTRWKLEDPSLADDVPHRGTTIIREGYCPVIWLPRVPRTARELATLAHEALHATAAVMRWAAIPFEPASEETYAHCQAWMVTSLLQQMREGRSR